MRSLLVEFHRFGKLTTGLLREGDPYLLAAASRPVNQVKMPLEYEDFLDLMETLRYRGGAAAQAKALQQISDIVTALFNIRDFQQEGDLPLQLDLVVNAAELAALPFEAALDADGQPIVARRQKPIVLTRRVRGNFAETAVNWPAMPRILFAWAYPQSWGAQIPAKEHENALCNALAPWIPLRPQGASRDASSVLTILPKASLASISEACQIAINGKKPFTHVHLLAHGYPIGEGFKQTFGLALHVKGKEELDPVTPEDLAGALAPLQNRNVILSLAACDSANQANTLVPARSVAHELHVSGFPVVIASQLPLTVPGSTVLVENFYRELLAGKDVRSALHSARCALFEDKNAGHDWASLVGYVRLPEGYADYLRTVRLKSVLTSLKTAQNWTDELIKCETIDAQQFQALVELLRGRINELKTFLDGSGGGIREENLGLLGSASKRLAELYFSCGRKIGVAWQEAMRSSLEESRVWYGKAFEGNLSHHWTGVQFLSLEAVTTGQIADPELWYAASLAAKLDSKKADNAIWAYGSLAELNLLAPLAGLGDRTGQAKDALNELKRLVLAPQNPDLFPLESTKRQMGRYVEWWTSGNGFFPGASDLTGPASELVKLASSM